MRGTDLYEAFEEFTSTEYFTHVDSVLAKMPLLRPRVAVEVGSTGEEIVLRQKMLERVTHEDLRQVDEELAADWAKHI